MGRYIDVDKLIEELEQIEPQAHLPDIYIEGYEDALAAVSEIIENQTTADVQEVKHGKNVTDINPVDEFICSECGFICKELSGYDKEEDVHYEYEPKFCPECGAKMDNGGEQK